MALHKVRSRVRTQNLTKKAKNMIDHNTQGKSTRIVADGAPERALTEFPASKELTFAKKCVPSKDELQMLRSNLSACIAAAKVLRAQQSFCNAPSPPSRLHLERPLDEIHNPKVASTELPPSGSDPERVPAMSMSSTGQGTDYEDEAPSASLLATTVIYRPTEYTIVPVVLDVQPADGEHNSPFVDAMDIAVYSESEDDDHPALLSIGAAGTSVSTMKSTDRVRLMDGIEKDFDTSGAVDHNNDGPPEFPRITFAGRLVCPKEPPVCPRKHLPAFTKRMLTLFAGRCRCCVHNIKLPGDAPEPARKQNDMTTTGFSQPKPQTGPGQNPPNLPWRHLRSRQSKAHIGGATPSLPVTKQEAPHATPINAPPQPSFLPVVSGAKEQPEAPTPPKREQVPKEPTILEVWDAHATKFARYREAPAIPDGSEELARHMDAQEDLRAERLRYGTGHCFGALAGDVYPYHSGLIF